VSASALEDATQDVFIIVHRRSSDFRRDSSLRTWLYGIVRNVAANHRRGLRRKGTAEPLDARWPSDAPGPSEQAQEGEAATFVQRFLERVEPKKRDVFVLAVLEEFSIPEVAEVLAIPVNTAYTRLRLVRAEFREALQRQGRRR
jgi:RNA polymerase sigma-70 factor (ECF subfamily)